MTHRKPSSVRVRPDAEVETSAAPDAATLARRRLLLSGLGKGSAVVAAAASPVASFATGRVRTTNGLQCSVSGNMSVVLSGAASADPCAAYHPTHFIGCSTVSIPAPTHQTLLGGLLGGLVYPLITAIIGVTQALSDTLHQLVVGSYHCDTTNHCVYYKKSSTECRQLTRTVHWPSGLLGTAKLGNLFAGASGTLSVLQTLHGSCESEDAYFVAAYFSALLGSSPGAGYEKLPFDGAYVLNQYSHNKAAGAAFFSSVCTVDKDKTRCL